jgi:hypothetical protein
MWQMVGTWIQFGSLLIALIALVWQQRKLAVETARKEKRILRDDLRLRGSESQRVDAA